MRPGPPVHQKAMYSTHLPGYVAFSQKPEVLKTQPKEKRKCKNACVSVKVNRG